MKTFSSLLPPQILQLSASFILFPTLVLSSCHDSTFFTSTVYSPLPASSRSLRSTFTRTHIATSVASSLTPHLIDRTILSRQSFPARVESLLSPLSTARGDYLI